MNIDREQIELFLARASMSKQTLAARSGLSRNGIRLILYRGTCKPDTAGKLAKGLGVPVDAIIKKPLSFGERERGGGSQFCARANRRQS